MTKTEIRHTKTEKLCTERPALTKAEASRSELVPQLRFSEFDDEWEESPIGHYIDLKSGYAFKGDEISEDNSGIPILRGINITEGYIRHNSDIDRYYLGNNNKLDDLILKEGDLVLGMDGSKVGKNVAIISKEDEGSLLIQRVARLRPKDNTSIKFIYLHIHSFKFHRYVDIVNTSSGIPHISSKQIKDFKIFFPTLPEQQKIASFLSSVETKLQQLTQKKELLQQYKKGVMQQLFSQQLRFKKPDGSDYPDWEEKRLDEIISDFIVPMRDKPKDLNGEIPWCRIEDFDGKYLAESKSNQGVSIETVKKMNLKVYPVDTLLVSCSANLGFCAIVKRELITNQTFIGLVPDKTKISLDFLFHIMRDSSKRLNILSSGTTISYLSRKQFEKFKIIYPTVEEQLNIANYLSGLDTKIESVVQQITQTQQFKKGLLQQMFVAA